MIMHLEHSAIDKQWWDARLEACHNRLWYARSHVLDAACPGWQALVDNESGAIMPLAVKRKWGFTYAYQPFMVQQLGVFAPDSSGLATEAFLSALPSSIQYADINLNVAQHRPERANARFVERTNMVLDLSPGTDAVRGAYGQSHRRGMRKFGAHGELVSLDGGAFVSMVLGSPQARTWKMNPNSMAAFERMIHLIIERGEGTVVGIRSSIGWGAVGLFVTWGDRMIFLKGLTLGDGRESFAMHRMMDAMIGEASGRCRLFDMAGGESAQLRRFYAGFGARPALYLRAVVNRLPQPLRWYKQRSDGA